MSILITQRVIPLKCQRCAYIWYYKGKNRYVATCPHCRTFVTIKKHCIDINGVSRSLKVILDTGKKGSNQNGSH